MAKSTRKKTKGAISAQKAGKTAAAQTKAGEYISCLLELHKLQGILLAQLHKEI